MPLSRDLFINRISYLRRLQEILRNILRDLPLLSPLSDRIKVLAFMLCIEIYKCFRVAWIPPYLTKQSSIGRAHQLLTDDIKAVRNVVTNDHVVVYEGTFALRPIVVDVVVERLPEEVETVKMVEAFDVGGEAAAVLGVDLDLVGLEARFWSFIDRDCNTSV